MSSIYKQKNRWCIVFRFNRTQYRRSLGLQCWGPGKKKEINRPAAQELQMEIDLDIKRGKWPEYFRKRDINQRTVQEFREEYLEHMRREQLAYYTVRNMEYAFGKLEETFSSSSLLTDITSVRVKRDLLPWLKERYRWNTARGHLIALKAAFTAAVEWQYMAENPFAGISTKRKKEVPKFYTRAEIEVMREYFEKPGRPRWQGEIVFFILNTGLRKAEALGLLWTDIIPNMGMIQVRGKGDKPGLVPLNPPATEILNRRPRNPDDPRVFWEIRNKEAIDSAFYRMKQKTHLGGNIHQLRKTYASHFMMTEGRLYDLKDILRHEDVSTVQIYAALSPDHLAQAKMFSGFSYQGPPEPRQQAKN